MTQKWKVFSALTWILFLDFHRGLAIRFRGIIIKGVIIMIKATSCLRPLLMLFLLDLLDLGTLILEPDLSKKETFFVSNHHICAVKMIKFSQWTPLPTLFHLHSSDITTKNHISYTWLHEQHTHSINSCMNHMFDWFSKWPRRYRSSSSSWATNQINVYFAALNWFHFVLFCV